MAVTKNITQTQLIKLGAGEVYGIVINSHSSGTLALYDGVDATAGAYATGTFTVDTALAPAKFPESVLTSGGTNFLDDVAATGALTFSGAVSDGETVTIGTDVYEFDTDASVTGGNILVDVSGGATAPAAVTALVAAITASGDGTYSGADGTGDVVDITATTAGVAGNSIGTTTTAANGSWANATLTGGLAAETVTIGSTVYRFKDTTAQAYDVKIAASAALTLDNLKAAINASGTGDGTDYHAGTVAHPSVVATANTDTTQKVISTTIGTGDNALATTETCADASWADTTLGGGTGSSVTGVATASSTFVIDGQTYYFTTILSEDHTTAVANEILWVTNDATALDNMKSAINGSGTEGTNYSTGTDAHPTVTATTNTNTTQVVQAKVFGTLGNEIATTETASGASWGGSTLSGGTDAARLLNNTMTFSAVATTGERTITFPGPSGESFKNGLYAVVGGTADLTVIYQ